MSDHSLSEDPDPTHHEPAAVSVPQQPNQLIQEEDNSYVEPSYDEVDRSDEEGSYEATFYRKKPQPMNNEVSITGDN